MKTYASIQAMRGVAATSVVLLHLVHFKTGIGLDWFAVAATKLLWMGVDIFFVISGFIMTSRTFPDDFGRNISPVRFAFERCTRIYPLYWTVTAYAFVASLWPGLQIGSPQMVWMSKLTIPQVLLTTTDTPYLPQAWTLWYEMVFYAVVTLALLISPRRVLVIMTVSLLILTYFETILPEFLFGAAIAVMVRKNLMWDGRAALVLAAIAISFGVYAEVHLAPPGPFYGFPRTFSFGVGAALLVYGMLALELRDGTVLPRPVQYLGNASYSIYLWHWPLGVTLAAVDPLLFLPPYVHMLGWIALCFAAGIASYEWLERPLLRVTRKFTERLTAQAEASRAADIAAT